MNISAELQKLMDQGHWGAISEYQILSEDFIDVYADKVIWEIISRCQVLSETFIEKYIDKVDWFWIVRSQVLSEAFIEKYNHMVDWFWICNTQVLSEAFIEKHYDKISWCVISGTQKLSENFIENFQSKVNWDSIFSYQILSKEFVKRYKNYVANHQQMYSNHAKKSLAKKREEMARYAEKWKLKFDGKFLYAFRNHDKFGRGAFNRTKRYETGKTYRDWHCDMNENNENSFGLGIWPSGNTPVKVALKDWGCAVYHSGMQFRKGRVWAFTVL